jgi:hypothetical protein
MGLLLPEIKTQGEGLRTQGLQEAEMRIPVIRSATVVSETKLANVTRAINAGTHETRVDNAANVTRAISEGTHVTREISAVKVVNVTKATNAAMAGIQAREILETTNRILGTAAIQEIRGTTGTLEITETLGTAVAATRMVETPAETRMMVGILMLGVQEVVIREMPIRAEKT